MGHSPEIDAIIKAASAGQRSATGSGSGRGKNWGGAAASSSAGAGGAGGYEDFGGFEDPSVLPYASANGAGDRPRRAGTSTWTSAVATRSTAMKRRWRSA